MIIDGRMRRLRPPFRDEVQRIGREALINAFRHAHANKIEIELKYSQRRSQLLVRDDGRGIDPDLKSCGRVAPGTAACYWTVCCIMPK